MQSKRENSNGYGKVKVKLSLWELGCIREKYSLTYSKPQKSMEVSSQLQVSAIVQAKKCPPLTIEREAVWVLVPV
jgi:hypothetical protein